MNFLVLPVLHLIYKIPHNELCRDYRDLGFFDFVLDR